MYPKKSDVGEYIQGILDCPRLSGQVSFHHLFPGAPAEIGANRLPWSKAVRDILNSRHISLYSHQCLATDHARAGHSLVVATPTASGKSLVYNLPVIETFLKDPDARALYLFPLKALAQDQLEAFQSLVKNWPKDARPEAALYDGDTSGYMRRKIRLNPPTALLSNPEMLNLSILPYHGKWASFLANLNYVIVDEAHTYRGMFGSHMAQVFRRLNRVAAHYGNKPTYIFCTATLGNPEELASGLMDGEVRLISKSGAPQGPRHFLFINPELAPSTCAIDLLKRALEQNLRVIVYCKTRRMTELVSMWAQGESGVWKNRISAYRAGFLPNERRNIEARMASGELRAVVSTSALELGIDIGGLDVCILVGYPGTIMQTLQRGGRVGRSQRESAVILVAGEDALDQYFMCNPDDFFTRPPEKAVINPDNEIITARHLECAAAELPLKSNEPWLKLPAAMAALGTLQAKGLVLPSASGDEWLAIRKYPQKEIELRGCGQSYAIENEDGKVIGTIDGYRAWRETHPGAVYIHRGKTYLIAEVDDGAMRVIAKPARPDWFTRVRARKETDILEVHERCSLGRCAVFRGKLRITETISGYEKRTANANRLLSIIPLEAPPQIFETEGIWFIVPDEIRRHLEDHFQHFMGSIHAMEHAVIGLLPLEVMADRNDFGGISIPLHYQLGYPAVFVYDSMPGGAGLTKAAFANSRNILEAVRQLISQCKCEDGCPSCIQSPKCGAGNRPLSKAGCIMLLDELLAPGTLGDEIRDKLEISPPASGSVASAPGQALAPDRKISRKKISMPNPDLAAIASNKQASTEPPRHYVVFDVETRRSAQEVGGWQNARDMGVSVAVLYDSMDEAFFTYQQDELPEMFEKMRAADLVVGFNSFRFDYNVLEPFAGSGNFNLRSLPGLDLLQRITEKLNFRVSLDNLGKATLNMPKSANGLLALRWWKEGRLDEIAAYCKMDVQLTRDLYLYGLKENFLLYSNKSQNLVRVDVDFSPRNK